MPRPGLLQDWLAGKHGGREAGEVSRDQGWKTLLVVIQGLIMGQVNQSTSLIFLHFFFFLDEMIALEYSGVNLKTVSAAFIPCQWTMLSYQLQSRYPCPTPPADCTNETHLSEVCFPVCLGTYLKSSLDQNTLCPLKQVIANVPYSSDSCPFFLYHLAKKFARSQEWKLKDCMHVQGFSWLC